MTAWSLRLEEDTMPTKLFFELNEDKQMKIFGAGLSEFAANGYENSSTNTIVRNCGISKGSLFKYFANKEDLYFYILDTVAAEYIECLSKQAADLSSELFRRITEYSALEFSWYMENPEKGKLIISAFLKSNTEIYHKTVQRYGDRGADAYYALLKDVDMSGLRCDGKKVIELLKWVLKGFTEDFTENINANNCSLEQLKNDYMQSLTEYIDILKLGLLK